MNYERMRQRAFTMLAKDGGDVTVTNTAESVTTGGIPDYVPGVGPTAAAVVSETTKGAVIDFNIKMVDGTAILLGDKQIILSAVGLTRDPKPGDRITVESENWKLIRVLEQIKPAAITVGYILQARRA